MCSIYTVAIMALGALTLTSAAPATAAVSYSLVANYSGPNFFDGFTAFSAPDPTNGNVNYTDIAFAAENKLLGFIARPATNSTNAYLGVDYTNNQRMRNSVRLTSKQAFSPGMLAVIDIVHAPTGYGTWPSVWFLGNGASWPDSGESDVFESIHVSEHNAVTLHTAPGCNVDNSTLFQGTLSDIDCNAGNGANGCSISAKSNDHEDGTTLATAGALFNKQGGAVYVHEWTDSGITVWLFPRSKLPANLAAGHPDTSTWKAKPLAKFSGNGCNFGKSFESMALIVNIALCGDWSGKVWTFAGAANATGVATCAEYVQKNPAKFKDAYFEFGGIQVYTAGGKEPSRTPAQQKRDHSQPLLRFPDIDLAKRYDDCANMTMNATESSSTKRVASRFGDHAQRHGHHHGKLNSTHAHHSGSTQVRPPMAASTFALP